MSYQTLHIYGSEAWHDDVVIAGNFAGLEALYAAIGRAIKSRDFGRANVECNDGEGYEVQVLCLPDGEADLMPHHYTDTDMTAGSGNPTSLTIDPQKIAYEKSKNANGDAA